MSAAATSMAPLRDVRLQQAGARDWAARAGDQWSDPAALIDHLRRATNLIEAAEAFAWDPLLPPGAEVLDLGCGSGWLTAILSARPDVGHVVAMDGSPHLLESVLPGVVSALGGRPAIVERICGEFVPLPQDDDAIDLVVMSSAFHHSDAPDALLEELRRVLRPGGAAVLLNETPWRRLAMVNFAVRTVAAVTLNLVARDRVRVRPGELAATHALYDPTLGDRAYTVAQWRDLARRNGFEIELRDSGLPSYKPAFRPAGLLEGTLTHVLLRPSTA